MRPSFAPFRHRSFALFWTGAFVSNIGTWMETVALGFYVADTTQQAAWTALIAAAGFAPTAVFGPFGGALADRFPRRRILLTTTLTQTVLAAVLTVLVATGNAPPMTIAVLVFASGTASAFGFPAYQSLLPDLVPPEDLVAAIGLGSAQWNLGRIIGPALAGVVIAVAGVGWALAINTVSFLAVVAVLLMLTLPGPRPGARDVGIWSSIVAGWRFVFAEPGLRAMVSIMAVTTFLAAPFIALIPAYAVKVLDGGEATASALVTAQGIGAVIAALTLGSLAARLGTRRLLVLAVAALPPALVAYGLAPGLPGAMVALVILGAVYLLALSSFTSVAQQRAPAQVRGRVLSVNMVVLGLLYPIGALVQGKIADTVGLRRTTVATAVLFGAVLVAGRLLRPGFTAPLDRPLDDPAGEGALQR